MQEEQRRLVRKEGQGVHFWGLIWGPQMKWFWRLKKALEAQSAMVDVFLAAMLGVTAADHERISEN